MNPPQNRRREARLGRGNWRIISASIGTDRYLRQPRHIDIVDLSCNGLSVTCSERFTPGDIIELQLQSADGECVALSGTISNRSVQAEQLAYRYGIYIHRAPHQHTDTPMEKLLAS